MRLAMESRCFAAKGILMRPGHGALPAYGMDLNDSSNCVGTKLARSTVGKYGNDKVAARSIAVAITELAHR